MTVGDVYQLRLNVVHPAEPENLNVFYYRSISETVPLDAEKVSDAFISQVLPNIADAMVNSMLFDQLSIINGMDNDDFFESNPAVAGTEGALSPCAPHIASAVRSARDGPGTRHSYKRFSGFANTDMNTSDGRFITTFETRLESIATELANVLAAADADLVPVQIAGGFILGISPVVNFELTAEWEYDVFASHQDTRQVYLWRVSPP